MSKASNVCHVVYHVTTRGRVLIEMFYTQLFSIA